MRVATRFSATALKWSPLKPPLYEQIGGQPAVDAAVDIFYRKVLSDDRISHFFEGVDMEAQIGKQKAFLTVAFGGPNNYSGSRPMTGSSSARPASPSTPAALSQGHSGPIHLYHGAREADGLYLEECGALASCHANLSYSPIVGAIEDAIGVRHTTLAGWRGFVCGNPAVVPLLKKKLFLAGMASREIFADAFLESPRPPSPPSWQRWGRGPFLHLLVESTIISLLIATGGWRARLHRGPVRAGC